MVISPCWKLVAPSKSSHQIVCRWPSWLSSGVIMIRVSNCDLCYSTHNSARLSGCLQTIPLQHRWFFCVALSPVTTLTFSACWFTVVWDVPMSSISISTSLQRLFFVHWHSGVLLTSLRIMTSIHLSGAYLVRYGCQLCSSGLLDSSHGVGPVMGKRQSRPCGSTISRKDHRCSLRHVWQFFPCCASRQWPSLLVNVLRGASFQHFLYVDSSR